MRLIAVTVLIALSTCTTAVVAAETPKADASADFFRCEKLKGMRLADLKQKLVEYCNLNKPFSIAGMDSTMESAYTYCCHKKD